MAQSLHKTKRRIASVNSTKKITKAMELVATVKLKKFKDVMLKNALYSEELINIIHNLFANLGEENETPYTKEGNSEKTLYVVINSNLGLCASYNNEMFTYVTNNVPKENSLIIPFGIKGESFYKKAGYEVNDEFVSLNEKLVYEDIQKFGNFLNEEFKAGKYKAIKLVYTHYVNSIRFEPNMIDLFPLRDKDVRPSEYGPMFDTSVSELIEILVPIYVVSTLYQKVIESQVSEQASRRTAMENATDNAEEIIGELTLEYNKARQNAITQEISEVISGSLR